MIKRKDKPVKVCPFENFRVNSKFFAYCLLEFVNNSVARPSVPLVVRSLVLHVYELDSKTQTIVALRLSSYIELTEFSFNTCHKL